MSPRISQQLYDRTGSARSARRNSPRCVLRNWSNAQWRWGMLRRPPSRPASQTRDLNRSRHKEFTRRENNRRHLCEVSSTRILITPLEYSIAPNSCRRLAANVIVVRLAPNQAAIWSCVNENWLRCERSCSRNNQEARRRSKRCVALQTSSCT